MVPNLDVVMLRNLLSCSQLSKKTCTNIACGGVNTWKPHLGEQFCLHNA